jgi:hypothetical protein
MHNPIIKDIYIYIYILVRPVASRYTDCATAVLTKGYINVITYSTTRDMTAVTGNAERDCVREREREAIILEIRG